MSKKDRTVGIIIAALTVLLAILAPLASAAYIAPHIVLNHIIGENGADFRIDMHDMRVWNASISNTGSANLTNIKIIINKKEIQGIRNLEVDKQEDLILLQPEDFPSDHMLSIISYQGAKEEIALSHAVAESSHWSVRYDSLIKLVGFILIISSIIGGVQYRKKRKFLILWCVLFLLGGLILFYIYLPSPIS